MGDTETMPISQARNVMETNFWGAVRTTQLSLPILRETNAKTGAKGGLIMQISSMGGRVAFAGAAFYHASKFALEGFTEGLAKETPADWNVHFLCVEPGGVRSEYVKTSMSAFDGAGRLDVYRGPDMPTNQLLKYVGRPGVAENWAAPERVAEVLYAYVKNGGEMALRLPLGSDAWGLLKAAAESDVKSLEGLKGVSCSTSGEEQLDSIGFLTKVLRPRTAYHFFLECLGIFNLDDLALTIDTRLSMSLDYSHLRFSGVDFFRPQFLENLSTFRPSLTITQYFPPTS